MAEAYSRLADLNQGAELSVAVRSSALDEDGASASFAGQHDTYLNVVETASVADAVETVLAIGQQSARAGIPTPTGSCDGQS